MRERQIVGGLPTGKNNFSTSDPLLLTDGIRYGPFDFLFVFANQILN